MQSLKKKLNDKHARRTRQPHVTIETRLNYKARMYVSTVFGSEQNIRVIKKNPLRNISTVTIDTARTGASIIFTIYCTSTETHGDSLFQISRHDRVQ